LDRPSAPPGSPQDQQHWFQLVFESTSDLMAMHRVEPDGRLVFEHLNRSLRAYHSLARPGVDSGTWIGRDLSDVMLNDLGFEPARCAAMLETYRRAVRTGEVTPVSHVAGSGASARHREGVITPLKDSSGRVTHLFYRGADITERLRAESELRLSAERFEAVFDLSPVPIVIGSIEDGRYFAANEAWLRLHGYARGEIEGRSSLELGVADPEDRKRVIEALARDGEIRGLRSRFRKKSGEYFESLYAATFIDWKGERAIVGIPYDVTELELARAEAQASSERFAKVFDLSPTPIVIGAAADGRYLAVNEAWLQLHGYRREELEGHSSLSLGVWADPAERTRLVEMISCGREVRRVPVRFRKKSGEVFESLYSATLADWKGERAIIATPQDVTELRQAAAEIRVLNETLEERVAQRTRALEEANRQLEAFSYSVSHDLRAPLRAISGFSELLAARPGLSADAEGADYARRVSAAASRMGTIVDALLKFSRLSRQGISARRVDLATQVEAIIADFAEATAGRKLRWLVGSLPAVEGDPTLLRLVMENLLDNAVKYTARRPDPLIEVDATCEEGVATIRVRDNGIGFDMKYAAKVFGVFERLHADDDEFEGTGIGLANAQRIVERHGGRIWCESAPGEGACFYFTLPLGQGRKA
jgi:PAS domain S-box-containing protein